MPQIQLFDEREKLLNEASLCLVGDNFSVPKPTETVVLALKIVINLASKLVDADDKRSVREIYLDSKAFSEAGEILPF
ncbi:MAG TPA: hypothetical protein VMV77_09345 [Bacteroidales bacterium]|nr:hypothetical protein [Bacteroidales bacterium]